MALKYRTGQIDVPEAETYQQRNATAAWMVQARSYRPTRAQNGEKCVWIFEEGRMTSPKRWKSRGSRSRKKRRGSVCSGQDE